MYESYWGLSRPAFQHDPGKTPLFPSNGHQAALLKLEYLLHHGAGGGVLVGEVGCGKSFVLETLRQQLPAERFHVLPMLFPQLSADEFVSYIADKLRQDRGPASGGSLRVDQAVRSIEQTLSSGGEVNRQLVIVVDDAHLIEDRQVFATLHQLQNLSYQGSGRLSVVLAGQLELIGRVRRHPALDERLAVKCYLPPLSAADTARYVRWRLEAAGCTRELFQPAALDNIHQLSGGVPRRINRLCDFALLVGFSDELAMIDGPTIQGVADELLGLAA